MREEMDRVLTEEERRFFRSFRRPVEIQVFPDSLKYNDRDNWKSPRQVLRERTANCGEGSVLAAAILKYMGYRSCVVDFAVQDNDEHLIAVFEEDEHRGAVSKSSTTLLKFREPVFRSIREPVMSYFEFYFNVAGYKSLRRYCDPIDLDTLEPSDWITTERDLNVCNEQFRKMHCEEILTEKQIAGLSTALPDTNKTCFLGASTDGLYKPAGPDLKKIPGGVAE